MFHFKEPSMLGVPWVLTRRDKEKVLTIPIHILEDLKRYDLLGIDFLYQKYKQQYYGVILNEEAGFNMQLQVATFFNVMFNNVEQKFLVLILCPDPLILNWHYHLTIHSGFKIIVVGPQTCPQDFDEEHGIALLVSFSNIKLLEHLTDYNFFSIVIDHLDEVTNKMVIKKLKGDFNIGLTLRSFYLNPDQKLHWTMMNWCNPGCVGKLSDFYEIDNDNFANFRNNYRHWWFRLTWNFCDSFQKPTENELKVYEDKLSKWAKSNYLHLSSRPDKSKKRSNTSSPNRKNIPQVKKETTEINNKKIKTEKISLENDSLNVKDKAATTKEKCLKKAVKTSNSDLSQSSLSQKKKSLHGFQDQIDEDDDDILMAIINNSTVSSSNLQETELEFKKQEILSDILIGSPHSSYKEDDSEDFLMSFLETDPKQKMEMQSTQYKNKLLHKTDEVEKPLPSPNGSFNAKLNDIDNILRETDKLLRK